MAFSGITKLISQLTATTSISDTDNLIVGNTDAKKITWAQIIALIKTKLNIGSTSISGIGDGTVTGAIKKNADDIDGLNGKFVYESKVIDAENDSWYYFAPPGSSYELISAMNGDWDAKGVRVTGVAKQPKTNVGIVFFETSVTGKMRINLLWVKG